MTIIPPSILLLSSLCAAIFGFAIVRGGVCTLAAVEDLVVHKKAARFRGFVEIWLWVMALIIIAHTAWGLEPRAPSFIATRYTIIGGVLLALGAFINQACPFGTIAGIGSGYWSYLATPVGLFAGCYITRLLPASVLPIPCPFSSLSLDAHAILLLPLLLFLSWRLLLIARHLSHHGVAQEALRSYWHPLSAAVVVGVSFSGLSLLIGGWAYTELLAQLTTQNDELLFERTTLFIALLAGAILGGITERGWAPRAATGRGLIKCFSGGALMGIGSRLVPGAHDGLTLIGQPLGLSYAWAAMGAIYATLIFIHFAALRMMRR